MQLYIKHNARISLRFLGFGKIDHVSLLEKKKTEPVAVALGWVVG